MLSDLHPFSGLMEMRIYPGVGLVEPVLVESFVAPAGLGWPHHLLMRVIAQIVSKVSHVVAVLIEPGFAQEIVDEPRAFIPPVSK